MTENRIIDQGTERKYFTMLPNIVIDMGLSPHALALYARIKRRAGDEGECWESSRNLAKGCNMALGMVSKAKKELKTAGLIDIQKRRGAHGDYDLITIVDIWEENKRSYSERMISYDERIRSHSETKNIHDKNIPTIKKAAEEPETSLLRAPREVDREVLGSAAANSDTTLHPAIEAIQNLTGEIYEKRFHNWIIDKLGDSPDELRLGEVYDAWILEGNRKGNLKGILDWYKNGVPDRTPSKKKTKEKDPYIVDEPPGYQSHDWCPEELHDIARYFISYAQIYPSTAREKRKWINELKRYTDVGISPELVKAAIDHMQNQSNFMTIASPKSAYAVALNFKIQHETIWGDSSKNLPAEEIGDD